MAGKTEQRSRKRSAPLTGGRRKLAYEIDHKDEGSYHLLTFDTEPATLEEVSRILKITDGVMRHLAVRRLAAGSPAGAPRSPAPEEPVAVGPEADRDLEYPTNTSSNEGGV